MGGCGAGVRDAASRGRSTPCLSQQFWGFNFCLFFSFYTMRGEQRAVRRSYRVALPGPPTTVTVGFVRSQQTPDERIISGEQGGERERGRVTRRLGGSGLTAGLVGRAAFFSSGFLATFSGRCSGEPSDLEEASERKQTAKLIRVDLVAVDTGDNPSRLSRHVTRIF